MKGRKADQPINIPETASRARPDVRIMGGRIKGEDGQGGDTKKENAWKAEIRKAVANDPRIRRTAQMDSGAFVS